MANAAKRRIIKAGKLLPGSFTGVPRVASVVFASPYTLQYTVEVQVEGSGGRTWAPVIESVSSTGFTISLCIASMTGIVAVHWQAINEGE